MIAAIVLAAGGATRFGGDKRLHPIDGQPMLARTLALYRAVLDDVGVVIRPGEPAIAALAAAAGCRVIEAPDAPLGQSRSLAAGVVAMAHADGLLVGLGDMPFVAPATLRALVAAMVERPRAIARPVHAGRPGHPVGFPANLFDALERIEGDQGARGLIAASACVTAVAVDDPGIHEDVDRPPSP